jgi:hypothetical protein
VQVGLQHHRNGFWSFFETYQTESVMLLTTYGASPIRRNKMPTTTQRWNEPARLLDLCALGCLGDPTLDGELLYFDHHQPVDAAGRPISPYVHLAIYDFAEGLIRSLPGHETVRDTLFPDLAWILPHLCFHATRLHVLMAQVRWVFSLDSTLDFW